MFAVDPSCVKCNWRGKALCEVIVAAGLQRRGSLTLPANGLCPVVEAFCAGNWSPINFLRV